MTSWSNPNPGKVTGESASKVQINPINIAGLVAAIIENKQRQAQQQSQQIAQIGSAVTNAIGAYHQYAEEGRANDAANSSLYSMYSGETPQSTGLSQEQFDQQRVPDYGGTAKLQSERIRQQLQDQEQSRQYKAWEMTHAQDIAPLQKAILEQHMQAGQNQLNAPGQLDDAINRIIYLRQHPEDSANLVDPNFDNRVPDYGGADTLEALKEVNKLAPQGATGMKPTDARHLSLISKDELAARRQAFADMAQVPVKDVSKVIGQLDAYEPTKTPFPVTTKGKDGNDVELSGEAKGRILQAYRDLKDAQINFYKTPNQAVPGQSPATSYTPGQGDPRMEGGYETSSGAPMTTIEQALLGRAPATLAVRPGDPRYGTSGTMTLGDGRVVPARVTDTGPGVRNMDIASSNPALARSTPDVLANARYQPAQVGDRRLINGVMSQWDGHGWLPVQ